MSKAELLNKLQSVQSELDVPKTMYNSFSNFHYRSAEGILAALKPLLEKHGLVQTISDDVIQVGDRIYVRSTVSVFLGDESHTVSAMAREEESLKGQIAAQITGGCSSYARKYALCGMYNIDDEGNDPDSADNKKYVKKPDTNKAPDIVVKAKEVFNIQNPVKYATESQIKLMFARSRDKSGLEDRQGIIDWFKNVTSYPMNAVPYEKVQDIIELIGSK